MVNNKRKKLVKYRGSKTHGCGSMKKRRGAGNRGGRGNAGSGKRGDANKPSVWSNKKYFGKYGFKNKAPTENIKTTNISYLEQHFEKLIDQKLISKEGDFYIIDLAKLGYNKLLGAGIPTKSYKISVKYASKNAIEKVKAKKGEVIIKDSTKAKDIKKEVKGDK